MKDSRRRSTARLPALPLPSHRHVPALSGDALSMTLVVASSNTPPRPWSRGEEPGDDAYGQRITSPPSLPPLLSSAPFAQRAAWLQALFLDDLLSGKRDGSKTVAATLRQAERRWVKAAPTAASHMEAALLHERSVARARDLLAKVMDSGGTTGSSTRRSAGGLMPRVLSFLSWTGDRRRAACVCKALQRVEGARRDLASAVERGPELRLRVLSFLTAVERSKAATTSSAWAGCLDPVRHGGRLPPSLDLVLAVDTSSSDAQKFACSKALGRASALLAAAVPGLDLRVGAVVFSRYCEPLPDNKYLAAGFPNAGSGKQMAKDALRKHNIATGPVGVDAQAVAASLHAAEALERQRAWRRTLGGWVDHRKPSKGTDNAFVVRRVPFTEFDPRGDYTRAEDDEDDEQEEEEKEEDDEGNGLVAEKADEGDSDDGAVDWAVLAPAWARHDAAALRKWRHQERRRAKAKVFGRLGYDRWVLEEAAKVEKLEAAAEAAREAARGARRLKAERARLRTLRLAERPDRFARALAQLGRTVALAYHGAGGNNDRNGGGQGGGSGGEEEIEEIEDEKDPTARPSCLAAGLSALLPDDPDDATPRGGLGLASLTTGVGAPLLFRRHATKVAVVLCSSSPLGFELRPHEDAPFNHHGDPSGLDPVAALAHLRALGVRVIPAATKRVHLWPSCLGFLQGVARATGSASVQEFSLTGGVAPLPCAKADSPLVLCDLLVACSRELMERDRLAWGKAAAAAAAEAAKAAEAARAAAAIAAETEAAAKAAAAAAPRRSSLVTARAGSRPSTPAPITGSGKAAPRRELYFLSNVSACLGADRLHDGRLPICFPPHPPGHKKTARGDKNSVVGPPPKVLAAAVAAAASLRDVLAVLAELAAERAVRSLDAPLREEARARAKRTAAAGGAAWREQGWRERLKVCEEAAMDLKRLNQEQLMARAQRQVDRQREAMAGRRKHSERFARRSAAVKFFRSEPEAALFVQSRARGFLVRRLKLLPPFIDHAAEARIREDEAPSEASWFSTSPLAVS